MLTILNHPLARALPVVLTLAAGGCSAAGAGTAAPDALRCEIQSGKAGGMITLQGILHSDRPLSGAYRLVVTGSGAGGSSNVSQGGSFEAAGGSVTLGNVMLGNNNAVYDVSLEINAGGRRLTCSETVGRVI